ncbi:hypothetical protein FHX34_103694 [Actinoplanes teichomyceticus]|uniref:Uncharacterized protein n=1 Tax=Actinoplanes teichomyceticus TaxID=1867 RepID=A0A561WBC0_ACTTI|nr:hypothetical protein FHX34_103694 [Actinoplanes teichomyceticus]
MTPAGRRPVPLRILAAAAPTAVAAGGNLEGP